MNNISRRISVVVADDHPVVLHGLVGLLRSSANIDVIAICHNGNEASKAIEGLKPDIAVLDMAMPGQTGLEVLSAVRASAPKTKIIFLTATASERQIITAIARGARGVMHKDVAADELITCLQEVAKGGRWLPEMAADAVSRYHEHAATLQQHEDELTPREQEVVQLASTGLSNKEIARKLDISEGTVKLHLHKIYSKLGVPNRTALTALFIDRGIAA